jgi:hypothetical protein
MPVLDWFSPYHDYVGLGDSPYNKCAAVAGGFGSGESDFYLRLYRIGIGHILTSQEWKEMETGRGVVMD